MCYGKTRGILLPVAIGMSVWLQLGVFTLFARAELVSQTVTIDQSRAAQPSTFLNIDVNPFAIKDNIIVQSQDGSILGGERDIRLLTDDPPQIASGSVTLGVDPAGDLVFETNNTTRWVAMLKYDGEDGADERESGHGGLQNGNLADSDLPFDGDLLGDGNDGRFIFSFDYMDPGMYGTSISMPMSLRVVVAGMTQAGQQEAIGEIYCPFHSSNFDDSISFSQFSNFSPEIFENVTKLEFEFNNPADVFGFGPAHSWDFALNSIEVEQFVENIPEPSTLILLGCGGALLLIGRTYRRKR